MNTVFTCFDPLHVLQFILLVVCMCADKGSKLARPEEGSTVGQDTPIPSTPITQDPDAD